MLTLVRRLYAWLRRSRLDADLREELAQHRDWARDRLVSEGVGDAEARRQAAVAVGNPTRHREMARDVWGFAWLDSVLQDLHYGCRLLLRTRGFTIVAVSSLAIGIGAGAAVFSLADAALFRTLPVRDPDSLLVLKWQSGPVFPFTSLNGNGEENASGLASTSFSQAAYRAFRSEAASKIDVLGFADLYQVNVSMDGEAALATAHAISGNYFDVLGVHPARGRALGEIDDAARAAPAAVVSDAMWHRRFGGSDAVLGKTMLINQVPFRIVGVMPVAFHGTGQVGTDPDVYVPLALHARVMPDDDPVADPSFWWVLMVGRLRPGVTAGQARDPLDVILRRTVAAAKPMLAPKDLPHMTLLDGSRGQLEDRASMQDPLTTMAAVTLIVLLVACTNVANLLLARGRARARELSVRVAIGAPRRRIVRQLVTESLLIAFLSAALGVFLARWMSAALAPALEASSADGTALLTQVDLRVLAFTGAVAVASALLFGLVPAFRATDLQAGPALQDAAGRGVVGGGRRGILSGALVVTQIALSLLLVAGAGLLVQTLVNLQHADLGFDASRLLIFRIDPGLNNYTGARADQLFSSLLDRLRAAPGVTGASLSSQTLISNSSGVGVVIRPDETVPDPSAPGAAAFSQSHLGWSLTIDESFFQTMGIPVLRGRAFARSDGGPAQLVVVNRSLARQLYGSDDVVGRSLVSGSLRRHRVPIQIIGVVDDARYTSVRRDKPPTLYYFYRQQPMKAAATFEVKTAGAPEALAATARQIVGAIDPNLPLASVRTQEDQIARSLRQERLFARLATLLGGVALALCAIGLYGLLAYGVARRTAEIGLRIALGAERTAVQWMVLRESLWLAALGLAAGVPAALFGTKLLAAMLFGLAPRDPVTIGGAAVAMLILAGIAGYIPARRAADVDPMLALRAE